MGTRCLFSGSRNHTRLRTFAARGITATTGKRPSRPQSLLPVLAKLCGMCISPRLAETVVLPCPGDRGFKRVYGTGTQQRGRDPPATTKSACANGVAPHIPAAFAGMRERRSRRDRGGATGTGRCKPGVFNASGPATARNRASGFGGDWQVRQQLPVGVEA